jgi:hypothetical protein
MSGSDIQGGGSGVGMTGTPPGPNTGAQAARNNARIEWRRRIYNELGGVGVDPELHVTQIDAAIDRALELWNRYRPVKKAFPFVVPATETAVITFFQDPERTNEWCWPNEYIRNVIDVEFTDADRRILGPRAGFLEGYYLRWGAEGPRLFFELQVAQQRYERLTGSRPAWHWDPLERKLWLTVASRDLKIMVTATRDRALHEVGYDQVSEFLKAATAKAKYMLARTLGALGESIPGAGSPITTDASQLRQEANEEWKAVEEMLQRALVSVPPPKYIG